MNDNAANEWKAAFLDLVSRRPEQVRLPFKQRYRVKYNEERDQFELLDRAKGEPVFTAKWGVVNEFRKKMNDRAQPNQNT